MDINVKILNDLAKLPSYESNAAAGADLYAATSQDVWIPPHQTVKIGTGIALEIPMGAFGAIFARSGLATKQGLRPANCVGVIDSDYRGEIIVALYNDSDEHQCIPKGSRIAQLVILPAFKVEFKESKYLSNTTRGESGFGSTGLN